MKALQIFAWIVSKARPRIRVEPERLPFPDRPGLYEDDIDRVAGETIARKYGEREKAPAGRRLRQLFTPGPDGQLPASDARRQAAPITPAPGPAAAPMATSTKKPAAVITAPAAGPRRRDLRKKIKDLRAEIRALEAGRKK